MKKIHEIIASTFQRVTMDGSEKLEFNLKEFCSCGNKLAYSIKNYVARKDEIFHSCSKCQKSVGYRIEKAIPWKNGGDVEECPICESKNIKMTNFNYHSCSDCNVSWKNESLVENGKKVVYAMTFIEGGD